MTGWLTKSSFLFLGAICILCLFALISGATLADASFATLRIIENFTHGYALSINPDERVLSFSNPLWVLLNIPFVWLSQPYSYVGLSVASILCYMAALLFLCLTKQYTAQERSLLVIVTALLTLPFRELLFSGQETILTCTLLSVFFWVLLRHRVSYHWLGFITSLLVLNQWQATFIVLPLLCYLLMLHWRSVSFFSFLVALSPLLFWAFFSLIYYGFFLPNYYYAWTNTDSSSLQLLPFSVILAQLFSNNFYIGGLLFISVWVLCHQAYRTVSAQRSLHAIKSNQAFLLLIIIGTFFFLIGSITDKYSELEAHQLLPALWVAIAIICHCLFETLLPFIKKYLLLFLINGYALIAILSYVYDLSYRHKNPPSSTLQSEHGEEYAPLKKFRVSFLEFKDWDIISPWGKDEQVLHAPFTIEIVEEIGQQEYLKGPQTLLLQNNAGNDLLLARLHPQSMVYGSQGLRERFFPTSYVKARAHQDFELLRPTRLKDYYTPLRVIASSDSLFAPERWHAILGMQLWWYDDLRAAYQIDYENLSDPFYDVRYDPTQAEGL